MKPEKPIVYVVSKYPKSLKVILLDRSLCTSTLEEFLKLGDDHRLATYGKANIDSDVLRKRDDSQWLPAARFSWTRLVT